jgi:hypothetical protein
VSLPQFPGRPPTDPKVFFAQIPFSTPFDWQQQAGRNLLLEVVIHGNGNNSQPFTYPLDAVAGGTSSRVYNEGNPSAGSGTLQRGWGLVFCFLSRTKVTPTYQVFGAACGGLSLGNVGLPALNQSFDVTVSGAPANTAALLFTGSSKSNAGPIPLPFALDAVGAPGCTLHTSFQSILATASDATGKAAIRLGIPADPSLLSGNFYQQYAVFAPAANALGFVLSDAGEGKIGDG